MEELKAGCLALAKEALKPPNLFDPNSKIVTERLEAVLVSTRKLSDVLNPTVAEYVFFPLRGLLQQNSLGNRQTELLFRILTQLCKHAWIKGGLELDRAQQLLAVSTFLLSPDPPLTETPKAGPPKAFISKPTSFHEAGFECIDSLFIAAANAKFGVQLGRSPTTAQIITLLLDGLQYDTDDLSAQLASISALKTILIVIITAPEHRALVLPRVASKLTKFVAPSNRRHFKSKQKALECFTEVIVGCIGDSSWESPIAELDFKRVRTEEWLITALAKLTDSFTVVQQLQQSLLDRTGSRPELLRAIYEFSHSVFINCHNTLKPRTTNSASADPAKAPAALDILTEMMLLTSSQNLDRELAIEAHDFLRTANDVSGQLESGFLVQINGLGSVLESPNETKTLTALHCLQESVSLIGGRGPYNVLIEAIQSALPLSAIKTREDINDNRTVRSIEKFNSQNRTLARFSDLGLNIPLSNAAQDALASVLSEVGKSGPSNILDVLSDQLQTLKMRSKSSLDGTAMLWIATCVMTGVPDSVDTHEIVAYCYEDLAEALNVQDAVSSNVVVTSAHRALACYAVGEAALKQGPAFKEYLVDLIHPLFSMIGSVSSEHVREQAGLAISKVAFACGYAGPMELAIDNKDYLVDGIALQLNTLNFTPSTTHALASLIYISGQEILPYLGDVFSSLFVLMDHYHGYSRLVSGILTVFGALVSVVAQQKSISQIELSTNQSSNSSSSRKVEIPDFASLMAELERKPKVDPSILEQEVDLDRLAQNLDEKQKKNKWGTEPSANTIAEEESNDEIMEEESDNDETIQDEPEEAVEKWTYPIPKLTYTILQRIVGYCDRLMTHESSEIRMATLTLTTMLMPYLSVNKEEFLPIIHKTWPEAIARVLDDEVYVVEQSFACLTAIARYATDFVASRIDKLWPQLVKKYSPWLKKRWPQFSIEQRSLSALARFFSAIVEHVPDVSLQVVESGVVSFRPALLRNEFSALKTSLTSAKPSISDLLWLALLTEPIKPQIEDSSLHTIEPVYALQRL